MWGFAGGNCEFDPRQNQRIVQPYRISNAKGIHVTPFKEVQTPFTGLHYSIKRCEFPSPTTAEAMEEELHIENSEDINKFVHLGTNPASSLLNIKIGFLLLKEEFFQYEICAVRP